MTLSDSLPYTGRARVSACHQGHPLAAVSITHRIRLRPRGARADDPGARQRQDVHGCSRRRGPELRPRRGDGQDGVGQGCRLRHDPDHGDLGARPDRRSRGPTRRIAGDQRIRGLPRHPHRRDSHELRQQDDAAHGGRAIAVRALCCRHRQTRPGNPRVHRGQRAEPEPLLAATVRPERRGRGCDGVHAAARPDLRRDEGGRTGTSSSSAALSPRGGSTDRAPPATRTRRPRSSPTWAPRIGRWTRNRPIMDGVVDPPLRRELEHAPDLRAPDRHVARRWPTTTSSSGCSAKPSTARPSSARSCRSCTTSIGVDSQIPDGKRRFYGGREPATTKPVSEGVQAAYYRTALEMAACQPTVVGSSSSTSPTRTTTTGGSRGSTTRTGRRSRPGLSSSRR